MKIDVRGFTFDVTVSLLVLYGPVVWHVLGVKSMSAVGGISGLLTLLLGLSSKTGASESKKSEPAPPSTHGPASSSPWACPTAKSHGSC